MTMVAEIVKVPPQPQLTAQQLQVSHQKTQAALERSKGVDGWGGTAVLGSAGVPTVAVGFWRDSAALRANTDANQEMIARSKQAGLIDDTEELEVLASSAPSQPVVATVAQVFRLPSVNAPANAEQVKAARKLAQDALDRQQAIDGCAGCAVLGNGGVASMAFTFWRDEDAMKAAADHQAGERAQAQQADPSLPPVPEPDVLEVIASAGP